MLSWQARTHPAATRNADLLFRIGAPLFGALLFVQVQCHFSPNVFSRIHLSGLQYFQFALQLL